MRYEQRLEAFPSIDSETSNDSPASPNYRHREWKGYYILHWTKHLAVPISWHVSSGMYLSYAFHYPSSASLTTFSTCGQKWPYPKAATSCVIGICSGALAAAAVSSSTTFSNLLPAAVHSVVISFRTGLRSAEAGLKISSSRGLQGDWSLLVSRMTIVEAQQAINDFSEASVGCPFAYVVFCPT